MPSSIRLEHLEFLAELPLLLNSSLHISTVMETALRYLRGHFFADSVSIYLGFESESGLSCWTIDNDSQELKLDNSRREANENVMQAVGRRELVSAIGSRDVEGVSVSKDDNFLQICQPLLVREARFVGMLEILRPEAMAVTAAESAYLSQFSNQLALAIDNAQMFAQVRKTNEKLALLNRRKDEMISVIQHELRTPLNVFKNSVDLVMSNRLEGELKERVEGLLNNGLRRLEKVATRLRDVTISTSVELRPNKAMFAIAPLFAVLFEYFSEGFEARNLKIAIDPGPPDLLAYGDSVLVLLALKNLISNAIRFTPDGGDIELSAEDTSVGVRIVVRDSGIGIEADQISVIFDKFYEVLDYMQHSSGDLAFMSGGLGLGLSTVRGIVEAHGSSVKVQSVVGEGSEFSFILPFK